MDERLRFLVIACGELVNSVPSDSEESRVLKYDYQQRCLGMLNMTSIGTFCHPELARDL